METFTKRCNRVTQRWRTRFSTGVKLFLTVLALNFLVTNVSAQIVVDGSPNDWKNLFSSPANAFKKYLPDPIMTPDDAFTNGSSDEANINTWGWNDLGTNDKTDIKNAGIYYDQANGKLYFFADRIANNGDAAVGIWILQNNVDKVDGGTFSGTHAVGDILVISHFVNGGSVDDIKAYRWNGTGLTEITNLVFGTSIFAAVNNSLIAAPSEWAYTPKAGGSLNQYPANSFFEGFIDLNLAGANGSAFPLNPCTARFLIETRNSQSTNAALGDFVLGSLATTPSANLSGAGTICAGTGTSLTITGTPNSTVTYTFSPGGSNTNIVLNNAGSATINTGNLMASRTYTLVSINDGLCTQPLTATATVTVDPASVGGSVASPSTVCAGSNNGTLTLSGHVGNVVRWESSTNGGTTWTTIANTTTSQAYNNITQTTMYRAVVQSGVCAAANSAPVTITVDQPSVGGSVASPATVCAGSNNGTLTLSGHVGNVVRWESSTNGGTTWTTIANTTTSQAYNNITQTTMYRAVVQSGVCAAANSAPVTITVDQPSVGGSVASPATICAGSTSGLLTLTGNTGTVLRWESSTNSGTTWTPIAGTAGMMTYTSGALSQTTWFRAVVQNGVCPTANSAHVVITVNQPSVGGSIAPASTICAGSTSGTLTLSGNTGTVLRWESSTTSAAAGFSTIAGTAGMMTYTSGALNQTTWFRAVVQNGVCPEAISSAVQITVNPLTNAGVVNGGATVCAGANGSLTASGQVGNIVRWESSTNGGTTWTPIANTTATQNYTNITQTTLYRVIVQSGNCPEGASAPATITVDPVSVGGSIAPANTICAGSTSGLLTLTGNTGTVLRWESSTNSGTTWTPIAGTAGMMTYTSGALSQTTWFRAVVQSGVCAAANSAHVVITVNQPSQGGSVTASATVCAGSNNGTLTLSGHVGNVVRWESSTNGGTTWTTIANTTTSQAYNNITQTTMYRAVVQNGVCAAMNSTPATITVNNPSVGGSVTSAGPICRPVGSGSVTLSGHTGNIVRWESSTNGGTTWTPIANTSTTQSYNGINTTTWYRAIVKNGVCPEVASGIGIVTVQDCAITYCTYTQGYYGNPGGKSCSPAGVKSTAELIGTAIANAGGELVIGSGGNTFRVAAGDIADLISRLPGGGPSAVLSGVTRPATYPLLQRGKIRNSLLSQTVVLGLNLHINWNSSTMMSNLGMLELKAGMMYSYARANEECGNAASNEFNPCSFESVMINDKVVQYLQSVVLVPGSGANKATVGELYALANSVLGGGTRPTINYMGASYQLTMEDISSVADAINNLFDGCRVFNGYDAPIACITDAVTSGANQETSRQSLSRDIVTGKVQVNAAPNPFLNRVRFTIESPVSGQGSLEVFNTLGQKVQTVFQGQIDAGTRQIDFAVPSSVKSNLIYVFRVGEHQVTGKLMNGK